MDEEGYLLVVGRREDMINRGGQKVSTAEIEAAVGSHADVAAVVAFSMSDERLARPGRMALIPRKERWSIGGSVAAANNERFPPTVDVERVRSRAAPTRPPKARPWALLIVAADRL